MQSSNTLLSTIFFVLILNNVRLGKSFLPTDMHFVRYSNSGKMLSTTLEMTTNACDKSFESVKGHCRRNFLTAGASASLGALLGGAPKATAVETSAETTFTNSGFSQAYTSYDNVLPFSSVRRYKITKLSNGLRVLLVSDRRAYSASVALSVGGAGQFADPPDLPGLAHLMEHMILSFNSKSIFRKSRDFQDWLEDNDGYSNAFTAYESVCFHFSCPELVLGEALERFAGLFLEQDVASTCRDEDTLKREIRRVDSELDFEDINRQAVYLTKQFVNTEHPYSRFARGSLDTLERIPKEKQIDVGSRLISFFQQYYLPTEAILVIIGSADSNSLERLSYPFSAAFSRVRRPNQRGPKARYYPGAFLEGKRYKHLVLYRINGNEISETISFQWSLDLDYRDQEVLGSQIAFVLSQVLGRRGPGSLYQYLANRGWVPNGNRGIPRVTIPVEVSGFQIIKLEINLTVEGVFNRASVAAAVFDCIETLRDGNNYFLPRELIAQYAAVAKLHGFFLTPRPPDAIELAIDAQLYGLDGLNGVGSGKWYRFAETPLEILNLQRALGTTVAMMRDPNSVVIITTAGNEVIEKSPTGNEQIPPLSSAKWQIEPVSGGRFFYEDLSKSSSGIERVILKRLVNKSEISPAVLNPLIPSKIRPPRIIDALDVTTGANRMDIRKSVINDENSNRSPVLKSTSKTRWTILKPRPEQYGLVLPRGPPESTCRSAFVLQLLSTRPARADVRQAAAAQLWLLSFEMAVLDLAELGVPGGLAYDLSFNKFGLRLAILGISQTLTSYTLRLTRRLAEHQFNLLRGPEYFPSVVTDTAIATMTRASNMSQQRKRRIISNLRRSTAYEVAAEGSSFLKSCTAAVCFAQGDLLPQEVLGLVDILRQQLEPSMGTNAKNTLSAFPDIDDLLYKPTWKPRPSVACSIPGVTLVSDACGRIKR